MKIMLKTGAFSIVMLLSSNLNMQSYTTWRSSALPLRGLCGKKKI